MICSKFTQLPTINLEVLYSMKNKLIAAGIISGTLLSYSSNTFADTLRFQMYQNGQNSRLII